MLHKETYANPEMEIVMLECREIIRTSLNDGTDGNEQVGVDQFG